MSGITGKPIAVKGDFIGTNILPGDSGILINGVPIAINNGIVTSDHGILINGIPIVLHDDTDSSGNKVTASQNGIIKGVPTN